MVPGAADMEYSKLCVKLVGNMESDFFLPSSWVIGVDCVTRQ